LADEEQCNGGTHQNGALPASIAELGSKAGIAAVISEEAESRWSEVKKEVRTSNEVKMSIVMCLERQRCRRAEWQESCCLTVVKVSGEWKEETVSQQERKMSRE
jgi:hypothetical protein